ncbi:zinc finger BED domain-containing protein RICESLEEPER 2-like [Eutrema salsugineum]|uniref:zinc finger BED domain-containing protein RICESLEEPER 2-like n=1 Tax=Eutrema salsugineum TaxID=72664 RepID=UPI000CED7AE2|nr:zinc finger BED domain-containing protein RICESLEEPER 2-like [Eutrema salsugineum]
MDLESLHTIALLDAQNDYMNDYMDMNEEDAINMEDAMNEGETETQEPDHSDTQATQATQAAPATQPTRTRLSFIDDSWRLHCKILAFCYLKCPHTGEGIASQIFDCLKEWGLEKKVFSITLDNATNQTSMQRILKGRLQMTSGSGLLCEGKYLHVRCCAHILNLIVKESLELAKDLLHDIRESVRYVKSSQQRIESFASCVERENIKGGAGLSLDIQTRWNSTYEMLVRALKFRKEFESLASFDTHYTSLPAEEDWNRGEKICDLLKPFSIITTYISGYKYPTSNVYFTQSMQVKFDKYWKDYSIILAMGAVLDPRMKVQVLEKAYESVDPFTSHSKIQELKDSLKALYKEYQTRASSLGVSATQTPHEIVTESPLEYDFDNDLYELERSIEAGVGNTKTHLDIYLDESRLARSSFPDLDILSYWKENEHRLSGLAAMARDILTIPITTVASESVFSIGAWVLTPYRNRLLPKNVQALLCTRNWLRGYADYDGIIEDTDEAESSSAVEGSRAEDSSMP